MVDFEAKEVFTSTVQEAWKVIVSSDKIHHWMPKGGDYSIELDVKGKEVEVGDRLVVKKGFFAVPFTISKKENNALSLESKGSVPATICFSIVPIDHGTEVKVNGEVGGMFASMAKKDILSFFSMCLTNIKSIAEREEQDVGYWMKKDPML